jgi:hypothetical protein
VITGKKQSGISQKIISGRNFEIRLLMFKPKARLSRDSMPTRRTVFEMRLKSGNFDEKTRRL